VKAISRRLSKLENRYVPRKSEEPSIADLMRERRRLRLEREGRPVEDTPREDLPAGLTLSEAIRLSRSRHIAAEKARSRNEDGRNAVQSNH